MHPVLLSTFLIPLAALSHAIGSFLHSLRSRAPGHHAASNRNSNRDYLNEDTPWPGERENLHRMEYEGDESL